MRVHRATRLVRLLLAAITLAGSVGSSPIIGHAHALSPATTHHHHGWAEHDHSIERHGGDAGDEVTLHGGESAYPLQGTWFGSPFSVPAPSAGMQGERIGRQFGPDDFLIQARAADVACSQWEAPFVTP